MGNREEFHPRSQLPSALSSLSALRALRALSFFSQLGSFPLCFSLCFPLCFSPVTFTGEKTFLKSLFPEFTQTCPSKPSQISPDSTRNQSRFHPEFPSQPRIFSVQILPRAKQTSRSTKLSHNL